MQATFTLFLQREFEQIWRNLSDTLHPLIFFVIVLVLFPLAISPDKSTIQTLLPAAIWVAILLATLMSLDNLFRDDYADGSIEQYIVSGRSLTLIVLAKTIAHWISSGLMLSLMASLACLLLGVAGEHIVIMLISLLLGTLGLQAVGAIGSALTVSLGKSGMLLAIIVLPLYIPILIFGAGAVRHSMESGTSTASIYLLSSITILAITLAPFAAAAALKNSLD